MILAAGNSSRFGSCKFLMPYRDGKTILETIVQRFEQPFIDEICIVTNAEQADSVRAFHWNEKVQVVLNSAPELERFHSVQIGLNHCPSADYVFIHNADMPEIDSETLSVLHANRSRTHCVVPEFLGRSGHPVLINRNIADHLLSLPSDSNLKTALAIFGRKTVAAEQGGILRDVDTQAEYQLLMSRL